MTRIAMIKSAAKMVSSHSRFTARYADWDDADLEARLIDICTGHERPRFDDDLDDLVEIPFLVKIDGFDIFSV